ncbi:3-oxo-5-alpha-steroid 4-dehydrogenase [Sporothrix epigloea]|uniref:Polyprenal reductase n=1 Tax=Sporothrix epigloea TaxID=1892477 RepID=A0ABP0E0N7_9PEZI
MASASAFSIDKMQPIGAVIMKLSPAGICQLSFAGLSAVVIMVTMLPAAVRRHMLDYGPRYTKSNNLIDRAHDQDKGSERPELKPEPESVAWMKTLATLGSYLQVPHSWFISFYVFHLICSAFWAAQWWSWHQALPGSSGAYNLFGSIVMRQQAADVGRASTPATSMLLTQVYVAFALETLQTGRRLYEYLCVFRPSKAKMNAAHFLLGLLYYAIMSVAIWIEGSPSTEEIIAAKQLKVYAQASAAHGEILAKIVVGTALFLAAWIGQFICHVQLSGLRKYSMPDEGLFRYLISPHYTCEIVLYGALAIVSAPEGKFINRTMLSSLLLVLANLGVTADRTKQWYSDTFGAERVAPKWRMIPFIF